MGFFSSPFGLTRERLTRLSPSEPLSRLSLFVIVLLDIFVLFTLFQGLASVTGEIESPDERFPALCRGAFELGGAYPALASETEVDRRLRVAIDYADNSMYDSSSGTPESVCAQLESAARALRESN